MEPMTIGSPVSPQSPGYQTSFGVASLHSLSISSPTHHQPPSYPSYGHQTPQHVQTQYHQTQSGFLPSYLMGDPLLSSPSTPASHHRTIVSPTNLNRSTPQTQLLSQPIKGPQLLKENSNTSRSTRDRPGGPPTNSLLFTPNTNRMSQTMSNLQDISVYSPAQSSLISPQEVPDSCNSSPLDTWITVWGFPPSSVSYVLSELSVCGTVLQHVMSPNSNWMHVRMQTRLQATKAVSKNGCVLGGSIMVGIAPCKDQTVLDNTNTNNDTTNQPTASITNISTGLSTPRTIRPLTQAYKEAQIDNKVVPGTNTPSRSNGIINKAMEYLYGW